MKKFLSILLSVIMLITAIPFAGVGVSADYNYITLGSYPQSEVTDDDTLLALSAASKEWISYGYMELSNTPGDYMWYCDIDIDGDGTNDYRGVKFSKYRPKLTTGTASTDADTYQADNGYYIDTEYYFAYEPLTWRVLDAETGLVMCENIIDSQAYNDYYYYTTEGSFVVGKKIDNNGEESYYFSDVACENPVDKWETSSIRYRLNVEFYNIAFNLEEKNLIRSSTLTNYGYKNKHSYSDTSDNIFLLTYYDVLNTDYGFSSVDWTNDEAKMAKSTDYAKSQGLDGAIWSLRTASAYDDGPCYVFSDGFVYSGGVYCSSYNTYIGIRPAFYFNLESIFYQSEEEETTTEKAEVTTEASETTTTIDDSEFILGDINGDGIIKANDARKALRFSAELETPTDAEFQAADVNKDGQIRANDARKILRASADLEDPASW